MGEKMNKTTTLLTAAGLLFLAGCKTEVMNNRRYQGGPPAEDPVLKQNVPAAPRSMEREELSGPAAPKTPSSRFQPMDGAYSSEGIEDETPRRKSAKRGRRGAKGAPAAVAKGGVYIVKPGDTLGRIARRHGVSVTALRQANNRTAAQDRFLRPGAKLVIPGGKAAAPGKAVQRTSGKRAGLNADGTYTMVKGDSIPKVARKFGIRAKALQQANNLTDEETRKLQIGHKLIIPTDSKAKFTAKSKNVKKRQAAKKAAPAPRKEEAAPALPPQPAAADNQALPPQPAAADAAPAAPAENGEAAALPPAAPVENSAAATRYISVAGYKDLEEFAAKNNTTVDTIIRLNPRIDRNAPISTYEMLYVPGK